MQGFSLVVTLLILIVHAVALSATNYNNGNCLCGSENVHTIPDMIALSSGILTKMHTLPPKKITSGYTSLKYVVQENLSLQIE